MEERKKILIVDDDEAILDLLHAKLNSSYDIVSTSSSDDAVRLACSERPDLIVCDIDMPEMDGGDVSSALFADPRTSAIPFLFLTSLASPAELNGRAELGGRPAISKRSSARELVARIESLLS